MGNIINLMELALYIIVLLVGVAIGYSDAAQGFREDLCQELGGVAVNYGNLCVIGGRLGSPLSL